MARAAGSQRPDFVKDPLLQRLHPAKRNSQALQESDEFCGNLVELSTLDMIALTQPGSR